MNDRDAKNENNLARELRIANAKISQLESTLKNSPYSESAKPSTKVELMLKKFAVNYQDIIDASTVPFSIDDEEQNVIYLNPAFTQTYGYEITDIPTLEEFWHKACPDKSYRNWARETWSNHLNNAIQSGRPFIPVELEIICKDNQKRFVIASAASITERFKNVHLVTLFDISDRKQLQIKYQQAQKMDALGTLAGGIAHDFNNILSSILGSSEMLMAKLPKDAPERCYAENIFEGGQRAAALVKQILTFSRMEVSKFVATDLAPVVEETLNLVKATFVANIEIQSSLQKDCSPVLADRTQIQQVVLNLCTNACHAMEETGGILEVELKEMNDPDRLSLVISDTGIGISQENQLKMFDPFFTTKELGKGTGLGLSVVHGIVEGHSGQIDVQSEKGKGTSVSVFFPVIKEVAPEAKVNGIIQDHKPAGGIPLGHILVVDDEPAICRVYKEFLEFLGYSVAVCGDGQEALSLFKENPDAVDLVVTDQDMPYFTGGQLTENLLSIRPDLPIILTTGFSNKINEKEALKIGIRRYLLKPVKLSKLQQMVEECLI